MKTLLITAAFLSAVTSFNLSSYSPYFPLNKSSSSLAYFQDTSKRQQGQYKDIRTGKPLNLNYNQQSRTLVNTATGKPVDFYINSTGDTVSSYGYVVNGYLQMQPDSSYRLDMGRIRSTNNRYYLIEGNKELPMDKTWPGSKQQGNTQGNPRRDSL